MNPDSNVAFSWNSPPWESDRQYGEPLVARNYESFAAYQQETGQDASSLLLDYDIFVNAEMPDLEDPTRLYDPEQVDLRLRRGANAIDAGMVLPNINDGYAGSAPDLGAYEYGQDLPHYGPRPLE